MEPHLTECVARAVMPGTKLQEHSGSEKAWVYTTVDFADEEQKPELFCIRFASPESAHPCTIFCRSGISPADALRPLDGLLCAG